MEFLDKIKTFDTVVRMKATDKKGTQRGLAKMLQIGTEFREVENVLQAKKLKDWISQIVSFEFCSLRNGKEGD